MATAGVAVVVVVVDVEVVAAAVVFSGGLPEAAAVGCQVWSLT